ncbi:hypothetical protein HanXRQr2_Chr17g0808131 [Helianthus annuus]|uniref:Uncharacterized protein n=1 Tax=Helianthus annuus TaxID=4232 RepID=A0A9K3GUF8_HELAN|nr:hypothetical protein HanXRQr2_Chr17g0808131 [Helianthus annuus]KAJ0813620.1 hypothetical protein HanPSC8_Chr17g0775641 [Helianthus annuus]
MVVITMVVITMVVITMVILAGPVTWGPLRMTWTIIMPVIGWSRRQRRFVPR